MTEHTPNIDTDRLLKLSAEVGRIAATLARLSMGPGSPPPIEFGPDPALRSIPEEAVKWLISARRQRARFLPQDLFAEPAWDILLDLLRAEIAEQRVYVSSLCIAAGVPSTTALRYINNMVEQGIIVRRADPFDRRRIFIELSPQTSVALRRYFADVIQTREGSRSPLQGSDI
jgi:DNA-binding MarR family transcriptional regulator